MTLPGGPTPKQIQDLIDLSDYWRRVARRGVEILEGEGLDMAQNERTLVESELVFGEPAWWLGLPDQKADIDAAARCQLALRYRSRLAN